MQKKGKYIQDLKKFLDQNVEEYNTSEFIIDDPVCIPHRFTLRQDIEIMGFFAAIFAWGQRKTIINKCNELINRMDGKPYYFIQNHRDSDLRQLLGFKHRTFNDTDLLYCVDFLKRHYQKSESLEDAFFPDDDIDVEKALIHFHQYFFSNADAPARTQKHISSPAKNSACKRINLYLRWMVRSDNKGVDFGIWNKVLPKHLIIPLDVHVKRTACSIGLLERDKADWRAAMELTENLRLMDSDDPVKYDYALFSLSIGKKLIEG